MKVVFLEDVEGTAQVGDVKDVKSGFARNFLLPRRLAAPAVEPYLTRAGARAAREAKRQKALDVDAGGLAEKLEGQRITIVARVGEQNKLYGSVTSMRIAEEVAKLLGDAEFDHRKVLLPEAIKEVGIQPLRLRLTRNVEATIEVEVIAEGEPDEAVEDQPEAAEVEAAEAGVEATPAEAELASEGADATESPDATTEDADAEEAPAEEAEETSEEEEGTA